MRTFTLYFFTAWFSCFSFSLDITHQKVNQFKIGEPIQLSVQLEKPVEYTLLFYKIGEGKHYQVRKMDSKKENQFDYVLESKTFTDRSLSYHFVYLREGSFYRYPVELDVMAVGEGELIPLPQEPEIQQPFPIKFSGNFQGNWTLFSKNDLFISYSLCKILYFCVNQKQIIKGTS